MNDTIKRTLLLLLLVLPTLVRGQDESSLQSGFPPRKFDPSRYEAIWVKNPFVAQLVPQNTAGEEEPEKWAEGLILKSVTRIGGKYVVHVEDQAMAKEKDWTKQRARFHRLVEDANKASIGGLRIVQVKAHRDPNQVKVTVSKGEGADTREAEVRYDPKALASKPSAKPPSPTTTKRTVTPQTSRPTTQRREGRGGEGRGGGNRGGAAAGGRGGGNRGGGGTGTQGRQRGRTQTTEASSESTRRVVLPPGN